MEIHGREIGFRRTVGANCEIAELCPNGDLTKIDEVLTGDNYAKSINLAAGAMLALNKWFEEAQCFDDPEHKKNPLTMAEIMMLEPEDFNALWADALKAWTEDAKTTVEAEAPKEKNGGGDSE